MAVPAPLAQSRDRLVLGMALRIGAASSFGVMSAMLKLASDRGVVTTEMLFYRALFGLPIVLGWLLVGPGLGALRTSRPLAHLGRSALGVTSILCVFKALTMLPLADATTVGFSAPIFATILSAALLREPVGRHRWAAVLVGFVGIIIVMRPGGHGISHAGLAIALVAAVGTAGVTVTLRRLAATENPAAIVFWFFICSTIVGAVLLAAFGRPHPWPVLALLVGVGLSGGIAQLLMTSSLSFAPVAATAPFDYLQLLWAIALGWAIWGVVPASAILIGGALIVASGLYTVWRERRLRRTVAAIPPIE